ncbi:MAG: hypothetical protein EOO92_23450 [Pedobacter sp.]|nr:MAG: hypothetical protein EOO92_23450 [Pedobacter sp.]
MNNKFNTISGYYGAYTQNPWQILQDNSYKNNVDRLFGNVQVGYSFNDKFAAEIRVNTNRNLLNDFPIADSIIYSRTGINLRYIF